jgi:hypothetical protein
MTSDRGGTSFPIRWVIERAVRLAIISALALDTASVARNLTADFADPPREYRPETWFHFIGKNISREGITKDLEAIHAAGIGGIHMFNKSGEAFPGVPQIDVLSTEWFGLVGHLGSECRRLELDLTLQNCPGWSLAGGPWVPVEEAQRELATTVFRIPGGREFRKTLQLDRPHTAPDKDYRDIVVIAFPTPTDDDLPAFVPDSITSNNPKISWKAIFSGNTASGGGKGGEFVIPKTGGKDTWVELEFDEPITLRHLVLPPVQSITQINAWPKIDLGIRIDDLGAAAPREVATLAIPDTNWMDRQQKLTLAVPATTTRKLRLTFLGDSPMGLRHCLLKGGARLHNWETQANTVLRSLQPAATPDYGPAASVDPASVIDLTAHFDNGTLTWTPPAGDWTIVRLGHVNMRQRNGPTTPEASGWECSKLDKAAIENHLRKGMIGRLTAPGKPLHGKLDGLLIDSWERYVQTWTMDSQGLFREFEKRRGYSMRPFLPALLGYITGDAPHTEKFLRDLRETMDDLYVENFFAHFATVAREFGAKVYTEGASGDVLPGDPLRYYGVSDEPMTEYWFGGGGKQGIDSKPPFYATSAANLYNKQRVSAEALTQGGVNWREHPFVTKPLMDEHFTYGINHTVFHTFSHTPQVEVHPGSSFGSHVGFPLVRNQTWWRHMRAWTDYIARVQLILQQGEHAADVLWYIGDKLERPPLSTAPFPEGYRYDLLNPEILQTRLTVEDGKVRVKDGGSYRIIHLRDSSMMTLATATRLRELVHAGAVILGDKPLDSPTLMDDARDLEKLRTIAGELWGTEKSGVRTTGKGRVHWGKSLAEILTAESIAPDVVVPQNSKLLWNHRVAGDTDFYFISSQNKEPIRATVSLRGSGKVPELWDPITGTCRPAPAWQETDGAIHVPLGFAPSGSIIVTLRPGNPTTAPAILTHAGETLLDATPGWLDRAPTTTLRVASSDGKPVAFTPSDSPLEGPWTVTFDPGWDAPESISLDALAPLSDHENEAVRYHSGTATYRHSLTLADSGAPLLLDLGEVADIARVTLNGTPLGTRWAPPFHFDLTAAARDGNNELVIEVTNTWRNQLVHDLKRPKAARRTWTTNPPNKPNEKPAPHGLIGPVRLHRGAHASGE